MKELDINFAVLPWKAEDVIKPVLDVLNDFLTGMAQLRVYFPRVHAKTTGGNLTLKHSFYIRFQ